MLQEIPKKLLIINDMAGFGRCSLTVALPVVSACKVQAIPVPTSIFSNHTGFASYYKKDMTVYLPDYLKQLDETAGSFDGIYCGYFGSLMQMHIMNDYLHEHKNKTAAKPFVIIDPVMGDHGNPYRSITQDFCRQMKQFITNAQLLTPNLTEACILTDTPYHDGFWDAKELSILADQLAAYGPTQIVITGIRTEDYFYNYIREEEQADSVVKTAVSGSSRPGTGDMFASIVSALTLRNYKLRDAVSAAADFIALCTRASDEAGLPVQEGVIFEAFLGKLTALATSMPES